MTRLPIIRESDTARPLSGGRLRGHVRRGADRRSALLSPSESSTPPPVVFKPPPVETAVPANPAAAAEPVLAAIAGMLRDPSVLRLFERFMTSVLGAAGQVAPINTAAGSAPAMAGLPGTDVYDATLYEPGQATAEISTNELRRILRDESAFVFDTRTELEYALGHLPGVYNVGPKPGVPMSVYVSDVREIERIVGTRDALVVLYCNGPFCGKSRRLAEELTRAGFTHVRRYQLGTPVWRALVGPMVIEPRGVRYILHSDPTAAFIDARTPAEFATGTLGPARNVPPDDVTRAKDDGRLPMDDFNTRVVVLGRDAEQAERMAQVLVEQGFNNVKYHAGALTSLLTGLVPGL